MGWKDFGQSTIENTLNFNRLIAWNVECICRWNGQVHPKGFHKNYKRKAWYSMIIFNWRKYIHSIFTQNYICVYIKWVSLNKGWKHWLKFDVMGNVVRWRSVREVALQEQLERANVLQRFRVCINRVCTALKHFQVFLVHEISLSLNAT